MGMFDWIRVPCPKCGDIIGFQSKAGDCNLDEYTLYNAPPEILGDISRDREICKNCGSVVKIKVICMAQAYIEIPQAEDKI